MAVVGLLLAAVAAAAAIAVCARRNGTPGDVPGATPTPAPRTVAIPTPVKIITWNIQYGSDRGGDLNGWPRRKALLRAAVQAARPGILCTQEALAGQIEFLARALPNHSYSGVGRDDGRKRGEHCAIFYEKRRFALLASGTFWLNDTPEKPGRAWGERYNRICTWVRLRDRSSGRAFFVFNTHFPLVAAAREKAARLLVERIAARKPADPVLLTGDFNCPPGSAPWRAFGAAGLFNSAKAAGREPGAATYHKFGFPLLCIDGVFASAEWVARRYEVVTGASKRAYPSDHFGVVVEILLVRGSPPLATNPAAVSSAPPLAGPRAPAPSP